MRFTTLLFRKKRKGKNGLENLERGKIYNSITVVGKKNLRQYFNAKIDTHKGKTRLQTSFSDWERQRSQGRNASYSCQS